MKKPLIALALITTVLAGGYTALWQKRAGEARQDFIAAVEKLNTKAKNSPMHSELLTYESVETSGFPLAIALTVHKPVAHLPVTEILKVLATPLKLGHVKEGFNWVHEFDFGDKVILSSDIMGGKRTITFSGNSGSKSIVNGQQRLTLIGESAPSSCTFTTTPSGFLNMVPSYKTPQEAVDAFKALECSSEGGVAKNEKGEVISKSDSGMHFAITHSQEGAQRSATLKFGGASESTAAMDAWINGFLSLISEATDKPFQPLPYSMAELGKTSFNLDMAYNGPAHEAGFRDENMALRFDVNAFNITSALQSGHFTLHVNTAPKGDQREGAFSVDLKSNISERYDQMYAASLEQVLNDLINEQNKTGKDLEVARAMAKLGSPKALIAALLPKFHEFGDTEFKLDVNGTTAKNMRQFIQSSVNLNALDILTSLYGIKTQGQYTATKAMPEGSVSLTCLNCDTLINDLGNYTIRVINYVNTVSPQTAIPVPSPLLFDGVKKFIRSIALNGADASAKDMNISFIAKGMGDITVSGKPIMELMQSYMVNIAPFLPQAQLQPQQSAPMPAPNALPAPAPLPGQQ